jgi:cyclin T
MFFFFCIIAPRDLAQTAYFMATNSLLLTDFCIKYSCEKVACFCIHLACKWTGLKVSEHFEIFIN